MRKRIWVFGVLIFAAGIVLLVLNSRHRKTEAPASLQQAQTPPVSEPGETAKSELKENRDTTSVPPETSPSQSQSPASLAQAAVAKNSVTARVLADWQTPINYYGKVIDDSNNLISGANVACHWVEVPAEDGNRTTNLVTDAQGLFSLEGQHGPDLTFSISKDSYYPAQGAARFGPVANPDFTPDPQNPIVFTLKKKGTPAASLVSAKQNYPIARDGTPVTIDLATGAKTDARNGNLVVQCWTMDQGKQSGEKYDWRCTLALSGGGLAPILAAEKFPFFAPEAGYSQTWEINMSADKANWNNKVDQKFYYRLADGRYGRLTFSMVAGGQHFFMIDSVLNPAGSRNLEPAN